MNFHLILFSTSYIVIAIWSMEKVANRFCLLRNGLKQPSSCKSAEFSSPFPQPAFVGQFLTLRVYVCTRLHTSLSVRRLVGQLVGRLVGRLISHSLFRRFSGRFCPVAPAQLHAINSAVYPVLFFQRRSCNI